MGTYCAWRYVNGAAVSHRPDPIPARILLPNLLDWMLKAVTEQRAARIRVKLEEGIMVMVIIAWDSSMSVGGKNLLSRLNGSVHRYGPCLKLKILRSSCTSPVLVPCRRDGAKSDHVRFRHPAAS